MMRRLTFLIAILYCLSNITAADWYVNDNSTTADMFTSAVGSASGTGTASDPFLTFGAALAAASAGDVIYVDAGLYNDAIFHNINLANLSIIGAGPDRTLFDNELASANTNYFGIIVANGVSISNIRFSRYNNANNSLGQKVLGVSGATGVTLTNLQFDNSSPAGGGAAVIIDNASSVTISGGNYTCNADGNGTTNFNGAISVFGNSSLSISNVLIHNNGSTQRGAGINIEGGGSLTVTGCTFTENVGGYGGAICAQGTNTNICTLMVSNSWFEDNEANTGSSVWSGGAIGIGESVEATISNCMFKNNSANGGSGSSDGGAISVDGNINASDAGDTDVSIQTCTFDGNSAANDGKAIYADERGDAIEILIDNCTFVNQTTNYAIAQRSSGEAAFTIRNSGSPTIESTVNSPGPGLVNTTAPSSSTSASKIVAGASCPVAGQDLSRLPVELITFHLRPHPATVSLHWETAWELNNEGFEIHKSDNGRSWEIIAFVPGKGTSNERSVYHFEDARPLPGLNHYRLKQLDVDGQFDWSPIQSIEWERAQEPDILFPNPVKNHLYIKRDPAASPLQQIMISDINGRLLKQENPINYTTDLLLLNVGYLQPGTYILRLISEGKTGVQLLRFVKG